MNRYLLSIFGTLIIGLGMMSSVSAHHGGGPEWQPGGEANGPISGVVTRFAFRFPHVQIYANIPDANGKVQEWSLLIKWTPTVLRQHGWTRNSIKPGDKLTATYMRHESQPTVGILHTLEINDEPVDIWFREEIAKE